jgi:hypothetical protein
LTVHFKFAQIVQERALFDREPVRVALKRDQPIAGPPCQRLGARAIAAVVLLRGGCRAGPD